MELTGGKRRGLENRPLKGETTGFLTEKRRKFLKTEIGKRKGEFGDGNTNQYSMRIKDRARQAAKDLALVAYGLPAEDIKDIFDPDVMDYLLYIVASKLGREVSTMGPFYQILLNAVEAGMNADAHKRREWMNIQVTMSSVKMARYGALDIADRDHGETASFLEMVEPEK